MPFNSVRIVILVRQSECYKSYSRNLLGFALKALDYKYQTTFREHSQMTSYNEEVLTQGSSVWRTLGVKNVQTFVKSTTINLVTSFMNSPCSNQKMVLPTGSFRMLTRSFNFKTSELNMFMFSQ